MKASQSEAGAEIQFGERLTVGGHFLRSTLTSGPGLVWLLTFLLLPLLAVVGMSFLTRGAYGELESPLTAENYKRLLGFGPLGFDSLYPAIFTTPSAVE